MKTIKQLRSTIIANRPMFLKTNSMAACFGKSNEYPYMYIWLELAARIASYLDNMSLLKLMAVNQKWYHIAKKELQRRLLPFEQFSINKQNVWQTKNYCTIDSEFNLQRAVKHKFSHLKLLDTNIKIFNKFFRIINDKSMSHVTGLVIVNRYFQATKHFDVLLRVIKYGYLKTLVIITDEIVDKAKIHIQDMLFNSNLNTVHFYEKSYGTYIKTPNANINQNEYLAKHMFNAVKFSCQIHFFIDQQLPQHKFIIDSLNLSIGMKPDSLKAEQLLYLLVLGSYYHLLSEYQQFLYSLDPKHKACEDIKNLVELARQWNLVSIINHDEIQRLQRIKAVFPNFKLNRTLSENLSHQLRMSNRLIDIAAWNNSSSKILSWLLKQKVRIVYPTISADKYRNHAGTTIRDWQTSYNPVLTLILKNYPNIEGLKILLGDKAVVYDTLAICLHQHELVAYKELVKKATIKIAINECISNGTFAGFTLWQIGLYCHRTEWLIQHISDISMQERIQLLTMEFPSKPKITFAGWTAIDFILYHGAYGELEAFLRKDEIKTFLCRLKNIKVKLQDYKKKQIITLFKGAVEEQKEITRKSELIYGNDRETNLASYAQCLQYLYQDEKSLLSNIKINNLPLLHFAIKQKLTPLVEKYILWELPCDKICNMQAPYGSVNPLQLAVIIGSSQVVKLLMITYKELNLWEKTLRKKLANFSGMNLLQYAVVCAHRNEIVEFLIDCPADIVNQAMPAQHPDYPSWQLIHIAIILSLRGISNRWLLNILLSHPELNINLPYVDDHKHNLAGAYPLSVIFYAGDPMKESGHFAGRTIVNSAKYYLKRVMSDNKISNDKKQTIITQALLFAIIHHDPRNQHDHTKHIRSLLEAGANPYQNFINYFGIKYPLIQYAYDRGLYHLFANFDYKPVLKPKVGLCKHERLSELRHASNCSAYITEDFYSIVSLVETREQDMNGPPHIFIVIEQIIKGFSYIHFIDLVSNDSKNARVRHEKKGPDTIESTLISTSESKYFKINLSPEGYPQGIKVKSWQLTVDATELILQSVSADENKSMPYFLLGETIANSSSRRGHNCYTWARQKLLASKRDEIKEDLKSEYKNLWGTYPTQSIGFFACRKSSSYQTQQRFFNKKNIAIVATGLTFASVAAYNWCGIL